VSAESEVERHAGPAIAISRDYRVLAANRAWRERYGDQVRVGEDRCHMVSHGYATPCDQNGEVCPLRQAIETGRRARALHVHHGPGGQSHCDVELVPLRDGSGAVATFVERLIPVDLAAARGLRGSLIGRSAAFDTMLGLVARVAPSDMTVLLLGESGTGKELTARAVHARSARRDGPLVTVECTGLPESLFESELFGHEKGAFTGATALKEGLIDAADGGTLFLDEIGDVPIGLQVKLLRLLESGTYRRVGGLEPLRSDFRLVCATNRDLEAMVRSGQFREDLYYRIHAFPIRLPPLRDRREDLPLLVDAFLAELNAGKRLGPDALQALLAHPFPGNVRELRNLIGRAALLADGDVIRAEHLGLPATPVETRSGGDWPWGDEVLPLDEVERRYLRWAAGRAGGRPELARRLGLSERTLYRKLRDL
jgi:DNA-binding NtrC family response regulator